MAFCHRPHAAAGAGGGGAAAAGGGGGDGAAGGDGALMLEQKSCVCFIVYVVTVSPLVNTNARTHACRLCLCGV